MAGVVQVKPTVAGRCADLNPANISAAAVVERRPSAESFRVSTRGRSRSMTHAPRMLRDPELAERAGGRLQADVQGKFRVDAGVFIEPALLQPFCSHGPSSKFAAAVTFRARYSSAWFARLVGGGVVTVA
jgi:hypothetical protein